MLIQLSSMLWMELSSTVKKSVQCWLAVTHKLWPESDRALYIYVHLHFSHCEVDAEGGDV